MNYYDILFARKMAGGQGEITTEGLSVTENGTYTAPEGKAYTPVVVNVPTPEDTYQLKSLPTGAISTITDGSNLPMPSLKLGINPQQDLHGYDSPWVGGSGRNLFNMGSKWSGSASGLSFTTDDDYVTMNGTKNGANYVTPSQLYFDLPAGTYYAKAFVISGTTSNAPFIYVYSNQELTSNMLNIERSFTIESQTSVGIRFAFWNDGATYSNYKIGIVISKTANIDKFYPYSNICPISGHTEANVVVSPTTDVEDGHTYTIPFTDSQGNPITVYGGKLDVVSGVLTVDKGYIASYNGETLPSTWISDRDVYVEGTSPTTGAQVVYELATPITYQLNPTAIKSLLGNNNIWADTGDVLEGSYFKEL